MKKNMYVAMLASLFVMATPALAANKCLPVLNNLIDQDLLDLSLCKVKSADLPAFLSWLEQHPDIEGLDLSYTSTLTTADYALLAKTKAITTLKLNDISVTAADIAELNKSTTLKELDLSENDLGDTLGLLLANNTSVQSLKLNLTSISDATVTALAKNQTLRSLSVGFNAKVTDVSAFALAKNKNIHFIEISDTAMTDNGMAAIAANSSVTHFIASFQKLGTATLNATANNASLIWLDNFHGDINGDEGAIIIAKNKHLQHIELDEHFKIGAQGAKALATIPGLSYLDISYNKIGDEGVQALAKTTTLTELNIAKNKISDKGATTLATSTSLRRIQMDENKIGDESAIAFSKNKNLEKFSAGFTNIGNQGAIALAALPHLIMLSLGGQKSNLNAEGIVAIANNSRLMTVEIWASHLANVDLSSLLNSKAETLVLIGDDISDKTAAQLATNKTTLALDLSFNNIRNAGAFALARNSTLMYLDVMGNYIQREGLDALEANPYFLLMRDACNNDTCLKRNTEQSYCQATHYKSARCKKLQSLHRHVRYKVTTST